ncbi:MAG: hypothetical protein AABY13_04130 [Nanoarchaeota archaeon]
MFEKFLSPETLQQRPQYAVYGGVLITLVSYITSSLLFSNTPRFVSVATVLFAVVIGVPVINVMFGFEARSTERRDAGVFARHRLMLRFLLYFFMGVFVTLFVVALITPSRVLSAVDLHGVEATSPVHTRGPPPPPTPDGMLIASIGYNNAFVLFISFVLSLFYGAGALLLIVLNASIFASTLADVVRAQAPANLGFSGNFLFIGCNLVTLLLHLLPEMASYLLSATAGGILGTALSRKVWKLGLTAKYLNDVLFLMGGSLILLIAGAFIEVLASKRLIAAAQCTKSPLTVVIIAMVIVVIVIIAETVRRRSIRQT